MFANLQIAVVAASLLVSGTAAYKSFSALIPNGEAMGKSLGHTDQDYTAFGTLFSKNGKTWAGVCKEKWPGSTTVTVGAALGDPCCKWTGSGATPEKTLSAPDTAAAACAASAPAPAAATPPAATPAAAAKPATATSPAPASGATPKVTPAATKSDGSAKATPAPTKANGSGKLEPTMPNGELCE